jgi:recombination associated protein RdgC
MLFKNALCLMLPPGWSMPPGVLEEKLMARPLHACSGIQFETQGWIPWAADRGAVVGVERDLLIRQGFEQKKLPSRVIKREVEQRCQDAEQRTGFKPGRGVQRAMRDAVIGELLPRAFAVPGSLAAWLDPLSARLVIDTTSAPKADQLTALLRETLGELPVAPPTFKAAPADTLTSWLLRGGAPQPFVLDSDAELVEPSAERATVRYARHELLGRDIAAHIQNGKRVKKLGLRWRDRISFVLDEKVKLSRIRFELVQDAAPDEEAGPEQEIALFCGEMRQLLDELFAALGLVNEDAAPALAEAA